MKSLTAKGKYFWLLNLLVVLILLGIVAQMYFSKGADSDYRVALSELTHYVTDGFSPKADLTGAREIPAGESPRAERLGGERHPFLRVGEAPPQAFTITVVFDYTAQYDALQYSPSVIPGLLLGRLGDSYEIYLNGHLLSSEWHVEDGRITVHKLARDLILPINPAFLQKGENILTYCVFGDPTTVDTGLTIIGKYALDDITAFSGLSLVQVIFAGVYLAVAVTFLLFFLLYRDKRLNLWFSATAFFLSLYTLFRSNAMTKLFDNYEIAARLEILALFTFAYFATVLIYTSNKRGFNLLMKLYTAVYFAFSAALLLPGREFVVDLIKLFYFFLIPAVLYSFITSILLPLLREIKAARGREDGGVLRVLSGTMCGNMFVAAFLPILMAIFDQIAYFVFIYLDLVLSQYGFLFFFANVTFALASDNAETQNRLVELSGELRMLVSERETELARKSGEIEEVKTAQAEFREMVSREIRAPLGEIIGAIELQMLHSGLPADSLHWLGRLLEAQRGVRQKLDGFLGSAAEDGEGFSKYRFDMTGAGKEKDVSFQNDGGTRHLFVINPKSFIRLNDLKNFLLSIEMCFSAGHRAKYDVYISRYPRDAYSAVYRYLSATPPEETARVYAVGGDGILFDCLNGLSHFPNAELAPVPYGNANDFARAFGEENMRLFRDVKLMSKAPARQVDAILCGSLYALCSCSVGIEARAVQVFSNTIEKINAGRARSFVPLLYKLGAVKSLLDGSQNNMNYRIAFDGEDHSGDYLFVSVGNIALNGGGNTPNPLAAPDDGLLDVITCKSSSPLHSVRMLPAYTSGRYTKFPKHLAHRRVREMHCESEALMSVILDGETFYTHSVDVKILPKSVKVVAPQGIGFADYSKSAKGAAR